MEAAALEQEVAQSSNAGEVVKRFWFELLSFLLQLLLAVLVMILLSPSGDLGISLV